MHEDTLMQDPLQLGAGARYHDRHLSVCVRVHGHLWRVTIPVEVAHAHVDGAFRDLGIYEPAEVGDLPSVDGLRRRGRRAKKKHGKRGLRGLMKAGKAIGKFAKKAIKSKALGALVAVSAMVCPAIGGPALAALAAAKGAVAIAEAAKKGDRRAGKAAAQIGANALKMNRAAQAGSSMARLGVAALRSA